MTGFISFLGRVRQYLNLEKLACLDSRHLSNPNPSVTFPHEALYLLIVSIATPEL